MTFDVRSIGARVDVTPPLEEAGATGGACPTAQTDSGDCSVGVGGERELHAREDTG
jgi:hypothetical protein